jgi:ATP/maltotriose-dependent transcriptional regulator MalT
MGTMKTNTEEPVLVPAGKRQLEGINRRRKIRELQAKGLSNPQICGELNISSQALNRHLKKIAAEDGVGEPAA